MEKKAESQAMFKPKTMSIKEACQYLGLGYASTRKVVAEANAVVSIGRRKLVNVAKLDGFIDSRTE